MIIDSHTHLGDFPMFNVKLNAEEMIKIMDEWNIGKSLVASIPNELTLKAAKKYPNRIFGMIWVNPYDLSLIHI